MEKDINKAVLYKDMLINTIFTPYSVLTYLKLIQEVREREFKYLNNFKKTDTIL